MSEAMILAGVQQLRENDSESPLKPIVTNHSRFPALQTAWILIGSL